MIKIENECVGCPSDMGCIHNACPYYEVMRFYCDECGDETELYHYDGEQLCLDCLLKRFDIVTEDDYVL